MHQLNTRNKVKSMEFPWKIFPIKTYPIIFWYFWEEDFNLQSNYSSDEIFQEGGIFCGVVSRWYFYKFLAQMGQVIHIKHFNKNSPHPIFLTINFPTPTFILIGTNARKTAEKKLKISNENPKNKWNKKNRKNLLFMTK